MNSQGRQCLFVGNNKKNFYTVTDTFTGPMLEIVTSASKGFPLSNINGVFEESITGKVVPEKVHHMVGLQPEFRLARQIGQR